MKRTALLEAIKVCKDSLCTINIYNIASAPLHVACVPLCVYFIYDIACIPLRVPVCLYFIYM